MVKKSIVICDDHTLFLNGISEILKKEIKASRFLYLAMLNPARFIYSIIGRRLMCLYVI